MVTGPTGGGDAQGRVQGRARVPVGPATGRASVPPAAPPRTAPPPARHRGPRWGRISLVVAGLLVVVAAVWVGTTLAFVRNVDEHLKRADVFAGLDDRPSAVAGTLNILVLGSDSRDPDSPTESAADQRTDTIMVLHIPASQDRAYLISIPRDTWAYIPPSSDGTAGDTKAKINAAYAWGGAPLMVATVERFTGLRMDHVVLVDFAGFEQVTDALGGVDLQIDQTITSIHPPYRTFPAGLDHLDGAEALDYVRQRYQFANGDFARIQHQQQFLRALLDKAVGAGTLTDQSRLKSFVQASANALTVDPDFSIVNLGWQFRYLRNDNLTFLTNPSSGTGDVDGQSVVFADQATDQSLYDAIRGGTMQSWVTSHPG